MNRIFASLPLLVLAGCGPFHNVPMPPRPDEEMQQQIDASWDKILTPVGQLNSQELLDVMIGTGAYQIGVDRLSFTSEKRFSGGKAVMEVHFDRAVPADDRFEVKIYDLNGQMVRAERDGRAIIEQTNNELSERFPDPPQGQPDPPEVAERRAIKEKRLARIEALFPKKKE